MPSVPFPDRRALAEKRTENIEGRECTIKVHNEEHSAFFGLIGPWTARHVVVIVPSTPGGRNGKFIHDTRGRDRPTDLASRSEHVNDAIEKARSWIQDQNELASRL